MAPGRRILVVITGFAEIRAALSAVKAGAYSFVHKPFTIEEITRVVDSALADDAGASAALPQA